MNLSRMISYGARWLPTYAWQRVVRRVPGDRVHLMIALADHFEPSIVPHDGQARAPFAEQERRLERWCREYPRVADAWRDHEGRPFAHTYFYPAEQYDRTLIERLAEHCWRGYGEVEIHLHHSHDNAENTRRQLTEFRDALALQHRCLSYMDGVGLPRYAFVHGNFGLANSAGNHVCGVNSEMQILAETGCYADLTLPAARFDRAQIGKINSLYECALPLNIKAPHRRGRDLRRGRAPQTFPLMIQGPLMLDFTSARWVGIENSSLTGRNPATLRRLKNWKKAGIAVIGRADWIFIKVHCHSMDPTQDDVVLGEPMKRFLQELVEGAEERREILHFVSAREMTNIILAACDGREGNPGEFRDYRLKRVCTDSPLEVTAGAESQVLQKG